MTGRVSSVPVAVFGPEAQSTTAQSQVRSASPQQRGICMAEKRGEAVEHGCIVLICIFGCGGRGQGTQEVVCARAGAIVQQQPRGLQVLDTGDALEETVMFCVLELQRLLGVHVTAKKCAKDREPLFGWQRPVPDPDLGV